MLTKCQQMGTDYCCIFGCHNFAGRIGKNGSKVTLHKLPKEVYTRKAWIRAISRKNWKPTSYTRVCSDHFKGGTGPNSIDRNKVPTENLPQRDGRTLQKERQPRMRVQNANNAPSILQHHSYARDKENFTPEPTADSSFTQATQTCDQSSSQEWECLHIESEVNHTFEDSFTKSTQTCGQPSLSVGTGASMPEIVIENIKHSNELIMFYTGLPDFITFQALFESLIEHGANKLCTESIGEMNINSLGRKRKLRRVDEFLLVMMRLRLGLLVKDLEYRFKIAASTISKIFNSWILFMCECLRSLIVLPELQVLQARVPKCFEKFSDTRIVLDCTEVFIQSPSSLENKSLTYSNYKSHDTFKALVGVSMTGAVVFVSKLWPGSSSDVEITRKSGLFDHLHKSDAVMVDKGFIHIQSDLKPLGVKLYCPPFKSKIQFNKAEVETTRRIASARIHVERKMEQIKNFRILQGVMPLAVSDFADHIFFVCTAITNLLPPLVSE